MPTKRPPNFTVTQLLCTDLAREGTIRLIKYILAADFDFGIQVLADEQEEEAGGCDDDF